MLSILMLILYIALNAFFIWRAKAVLMKAGVILGFIISGAVLFVSMSATLLLAGFIPRSALRTAFKIFSNYWVAFVVFLLFFLVIAELATLIIKWSNHGKLPHHLTKRRYMWMAFGSVVLASVLMLTFGGIHARKLHVNSYEVTVSKPCAEKELNFVLVSDLHLGYTFNEREMETMVDCINAQNADAVFIAGDIIDNEFDVLENPARIAEIFRGIKSTYGVFAVYGNHDVDATLIGGFSVTPSDKQFRDPKVVEFCKDSGFTMLEDRSIDVAGLFTVVGRLDGEKAGDGTDHRATVSELMKDVDTDKPVIMLCHEPDDSKEYSAAGVDIQLSGHTHAGQFFPLTVMCPIRWDNAWGYKQYGRMHGFTTAGVGVYGPPVRVFTNSEVMTVKVRFE